MRTWAFWKGGKNEREKGLVARFHPYRYATFCALARVDVTDEKAAAAGLPPVDGMNVWPLISGQNSTSPRVDLPLSKQTLISGRYKIVTGKSQYSVWTGPQYPNTTSGPVKE